MKFLNFLYFGGPFCSPGSCDLIESGSNPGPIRSGSETLVGGGGSVFIPYIRLTVNHNSDLDTKLENNKYLKESDKKHVRKRHRSAYVLKCN